MYFDNFDALFLGKTTRVKKNNTLESQPILNWWYPSQVNNIDEQEHNDVEIIKLESLDVDQDLIDEHDNELMKMEDVEIIPDSLDDSDEDGEDSGGKGNPNYSPIKKASPSTMR